MTASSVIDQAGRFACPLCPRRFTVLGDKKQHMRSEHGPKPAKAER